MNIDTLNANGGFGFNPEPRPSEGRLTLNVAASRFCDVALWAVSRSASAVPVASRARHASMFPLDAKSASVLLLRGRTRLAVFFEPTGLSHAENALCAAGLGFRVCSGFQGLPLADLPFFSDLRSDETTC